MEMHARCILENRLIHFSYVHSTYISSCLRLETKRKTITTSGIIIDTFTAVPVDRRRFLRILTAMHLDFCSSATNSPRRVHISWYFELSPRLSKAINFLYSLDGISMHFSIFYVSLLATEDDDAYS